MCDHVIKAGTGEPFLTQERCTIRELANTPAIGAFSLAEAHVAPGVTTELHRLSIDEWYVMSVGSGLVEVGGETAAVGPGDVVAIPAGASQRITNTGDGQLVFLCVCQPRFTPDCYEPLEER